MDERSPSSVLRKTISEPQTGSNPQPSDASHRSSEDSGFDPRPGLRNSFSEDRA